MYSPDVITDLQAKHRDYYTSCLRLQERIITTSTKMPKQAASHAVYGIARRLRTLRECMRFFFETIPPDISSEMDEDTQAQANANLHAYLINCCGIFDNMAWSLAYFLGLDSKMDLEKEKHKVGLFNKSFKPHLSPALASRIDEFNEWYEFLTNQRHPTAHRIPPYIIPYIHYTNTDRIDFTPYYVHAFETSSPIPLHAQCICDIGAVILTVEAWLDSIDQPTA